MVEFKGKLWLFGGTQDPEENDANRIMNDIWSSDDGIIWKKISDNAPWKPRKHPGAVVFKDQLWLMGGIDHADVWRSEDGKTWVQVTGKAPWEVRSDFGLKIYDNLMFVFGGRGGNPARDFNDVWFSIDGKDWRLQTERAPWTEQTGTHSVVFRNKLWLYNGKHKGSTRAGDIWTMESAHK
jgi:N-acetylneuraminic acid mutarotase